MTQIPAEDTVVEAGGPTVVPPRLAAGSNESYGALVWRRLRRSAIGFTGLCLVSFILTMSVFAEFFAPVDPKLQDTGFAPPETISFATADGGWTIFPVSISEKLPEPSWSR